MGRFAGISFIQRESGDQVSSRVCKVDWKSTATKMGPNAGKLPEEGDRGVSDTAKQVPTPSLHACSVLPCVASRQRLREHDH